MIDPDSLLRLARDAAGSGPGRPNDARLRRGVSTAYYAAFHHLTHVIAEHLISHAPAIAKSGVRRTWTHSEMKAACHLIVKRAGALAHNPTAKAQHDVLEAGPLVDLAAADSDIAAAARLFEQLQDLRHDADYDHLAAISKASLLSACADVDTFRTQLTDATPAGRQALLSLLVVRRPDLRPRA